MNALQIAAVGAEVAVVSSLASDGQLTRTGA